MLTSLLIRFNTSITPMNFTERNWIINFNFNIQGHIFTDIASELEYV